MSYIPRNYLKRNRKYRQVTLFDIALLLHHMHLAAQDSEIGFEDTHETINSLERKLNREKWVDPRLIESCLWSSNLLNEQGKFWHPKNLKFEEWLTKILGKTKFNQIYNVIEDEKD